MTFISTTIRWRWLPLLLLPVLLVMLAGCQNFNKPPDNNLASITVTNRTLAQVSTAVRTVFESHYFKGGPAGTGLFIYERPGSRMNNLAYGSYFFEEKVTVKVTVNVEPIYGGQFLVSCDAKLIEDAGDPVFKDSHHVRELQKWPYQQLLNDIKTQLNE